MGVDGNRRQVVPTFLNDDGPAVQLGHQSTAAGHSVTRHKEISEGVTGRCVEAQRHDDQLGIEVVDRLNRLREVVQIFIVPGTGGDRHIECCADPGVDPDLISGAAEIGVCARRITVERGVHHVGSMPEDLLCSVAVMKVDVEYGDARAASIDRCLGDDCCVVEVAVPAVRGAGSVVAGRTAQRVGHGFAGVDSIECRQRDVDRSPGRRVRPSHEWSVCLPAPIAQLALDRRWVVGGAHTLEDGRVCHDIGEDLTLTTGVRLESSPRIGEERDESRIVDRLDCVEAVIAHLDAKEARVGLELLSDRIGTSWYLEHGCRAAPAHLDRWIVCPVVVRCDEDHGEVLSHADWLASATLTAMSSALDNVGRLAVLAIPVFMGFLVARLHLIENVGSAIGGLNVYSLYVGFPALIAAGIITGRFDVSSNVGFWVAVPILDIALVMVCLLAARFAPGRQAGTLALVCLFGNTAYLGLPFVVSIFGESVRGPAALLVAIQVAIAAGVGPVVLVAWSGRAGQRVTARQIVGQPLLWAPILGVVARWFPSGVRSGLATALAPLAASAAPLAMFVLGLYLFDQRGLMRRAEPGVWVHVAVRLLVGPVLTFLVCLALVEWASLDRTAARILVVLGGVPAAVTTFAIAQQSDVAPARVASTVMRSSLVSLATLPVLATVAQQLFV